MDTHLRLEMSHFQVALPGFLQRDRNVVEYHSVFELGNAEGNKGMKKRLVVMTSKYFRIRSNYEQS